MRKCIGHSDLFHLAYKTPRTFTDTTFFPKNPPGHRARGSTLGPAFGTPHQRSDRTQLAGTKGPKPSRSESMNPPTTSRRKDVWFRVQPRVCLEWSYFFGCFEDMTNLFWLVRQCNKPPIIIKFFYFPIIIIIIMIIIIIIIIIVRSTVPDHDLMTYALPVVCGSRRPPASARLPWRWGRFGVRDVRR